MDRTYKLRAFILNIYMRVSPLAHRVAHILKRFSLGAFRALKWIVKHIVKLLKIVGIMVVVYGMKFMRLICKVLESKWFWGIAILEGTLYLVDHYHVPWTTIGPLLLGVVFGMLVRDGKSETHITVPGFTSSKGLDAIESQLRDYYRILREHDQNNPVDNTDQIHV